VLKSHVLLSWSDLNRPPGKGQFLIPLFCLARPMLSSIFVFDILQPGEHPVEDELVDFRFLCEFDHGVIFLL
jgi:hypothetical protein